MEKNVKNYYEILEVDKKASPEVIEKAYKTLVKNIIQIYKRQKIMVNTKKK